MYFVFSLVIFGLLKLKLGEQVIPVSNHRLYFLDYLIQLSLLIRFSCCFLCTSYALLSTCCNIFARNPWSLQKASLPQMLNLFWLEAADTNALALTHTLSPHVLFQPRCQTLTAENHIRKRNEGTKCMSEQHAATQSAHLRLAPGKRRGSTSGRLTLRAGGVSHGTNQSELRHCLCAQTKPPPGECRRSHRQQALRHLTTSRPD